MMAPRSFIHSFSLLALLVSSSCALPCDDKASVAPIPPAEYITATANVTDSYSMEPTSFSEPSASTTIYYSEPTPTQTDIPVPSSKPPPSGSNVYQLMDKIQGPDFYNAFEWEDIADPTHGRVNYVDMETSKRENLTYASADTFILRTDYKTVLDPAGPGRNSVRIKSKKAYRNHVAVFDINHMPQGCGTWPAVWEVGPNWPHQGEFDILEGTNDEGPNAATLHTGPGCRMTSSREGFRGVRVQEDCDVANGNVGCPVKFTSPNSYGPDFNAVGGGWYAIERAPKYMKVWHWARNDPSVPADVVNADVAAVDTSSWGKPQALFPNTSCDMQEHFGRHNIIINLTLCGDWAGTTYENTSCPGTCIDLVNSSPEAFEKAYFKFSSVRVYQKWL